MNEKESYLPLNLYGKLSTDQIFPKQEQKFQQT